MAGNRIVVYTALFGGYDELVDPPLIDGCDYVCFTDCEDLKSERFRIVQCDNLFLDPSRDNRMYKVLPHRYFPEYEYSLYMDASVRMNRVDLYELIQKYLLTADLALFRHGKRSCLYKERRICAKKGKDHIQVMNEQIARYLQEGFPEEWGLTENTVLLRRHNADVMVGFSEDWWREIEMGSRRDQLSFAYVAWKRGLVFSSFPGTVRHNPWFSNYPHKVAKGRIGLSVEEENILLKRELKQLNYALERARTRIEEHKRSWLCRLARSLKKRR